MFKTRYLVIEESKRWHDFNIVGLRKRLPILKANQRAVMLEISLPNTTFEQVIPTIPLTIQQEQIQKSAPTVKAG